SIVAAQGPAPTGTFHCYFGQPAGDTGGDLSQTPCNVDNPSFSYQTPASQFFGPQPFIVNIANVRLNEPERIGFQEFFVDDSIFTSVSSPLQAPRCDSPYEVEEPGPTLDDPVCQALMPSFGAPVLSITCTLQKQQPTGGFQTVTSKSGTACGLALVNPND